MSSIIFITGMSGSGKSTISQGVAEHFPQAMYLDVDQLRQRRLDRAGLRRLDS